MFKCNDCGREFFEPKIIRDVIKYGNGDIPGPALAMCPFCGSNFEEAKYCELCGDSYIDSEHDGVCNSCMGIIEKRFSELLNANFTKFEIDILNTVYDGRNLE